MEQSTSTSQTANIVPSGTHVYTATTVVEPGDELRQFMNQEDTFSIEIGVVIALLFGIYMWRVL